MIDECIKRYPALEECREEIVKIADILIECFKNGGKLLVCGNGGSCSDSSHIAGELLKGFYQLRPLPEQVKAAFQERFGEEGKWLADKLQGSLPVISLPDQTGILTAFNNDVDAAAGYAQLVYGYAKPGDVFMGLSTSGNSKNVVHAARTAAICGAKTVALTGKNTCLLDEVCDVVIHVPETVTANVQELHLPVYHVLCAEVEKRLFPEGK